MLTPANTDAGLHATAYLTPDIDDCEIVSAAANQCISATALSICYAGEDEIRVAVGTLGSLARELT